MSLLQLLSILRARFGWVLLCLGLALGAAAAIVRYLPPTYIATTSVVIAYKDSDPFEKPGTAEPLSPGYVTTQVDIATSHAVARRVVETMNLADDPELVQQFRDAGANGEIEDWLAARLMKRLDVQPARESRVVEFRYAARDPQFAATAADAFAQAYIETQLNLSVNPARRNTAWLEEQSKGLRENLERAQARLTEYQQRHGIVSGGGDNGKLDVETQRMAELSAQLVAAQAQRYDTSSRQLGENHPQYQRAAAQEESIRRSLAEQKAKVLQLRKQYDGIDTLQREVESAQRAYDAALQRHSQTSLEGELNQTNVSVLGPAVVPTRPASPNAPRILAIGAVLGVLVGIGAALLREIGDRRVRSAQDVEADLGLPVVGELLKGN